MHYFKTQVKEWLCKIPISPEYGKFVRLKIKRLQGEIEHEYIKNHLIFFKYV